MTTPTGWPSAKVYSRRVRCAEICHDSAVVAAGRGTRAAGAGRAVAAPELGCHGGAGRLLPAALPATACLSPGTGADYPWHADRTAGIRRSGAGAVGPAGQRHGLLHQLPRRAGAHPAAGPASAASARDAQGTADRAATVALPALCTDRRQYRFDSQLRHDEPDVRYAAAASAAVSSG